MTPIQLRAAAMLRLHELSEPESQAGKICTVIFLHGSHIKPKAYFSRYPAWLNADERIEPVPLTVQEEIAHGIKFEVHIGGKLWSGST